MQGQITRSDTQCSICLVLGLDLKREFILQRVNFWPPFEAEGRVLLLGPKRKALELFDRGDVKLEL